MKKKLYKYNTELAINMYLSKYQFLQQAELQMLSKSQTSFNNHTPYNIYFILRRPRLSLDSEYCLIKQAYIELKYYINVQDVKYERKFKVNIKTNKDTQVKTDYPYNYFSILNALGTDLHYKLAVVIDMVHAKSKTIEPLLDYEILYIGQAYGKNGQRTAIDRLASHSTLQKINSEASHRNPDSEIWIMLGAFTQRNISTLNGRVSIPIENEEKDNQRMLNFANPDITKFSEKQKINFTEAALIKMFLPLYNKEYKNTFPNPAHSSYSECYELDINAIVIETDTTEVRRWLHTGTKRRIVGDLGIKYYQNSLHYFINDKARYKMFNYDYL